MNRILTVLTKLTIIMVCTLSFGHLLSTHAKALTSEELLIYWASRYPSILPRPVVSTIPDFLLAKAQTDECFFDIGHPANSYNPFLYLNPSACTNAGGALKVNQAYVWGMAKSGRELWFGTMSNTHCLVIGGYLGSTTTILNESYACEFGQGPFSPPLPDAIGDWRPPRIFVYNSETSTFTEKNTWSACPNPNAASGPCLQYTLGLRSGGALGDIVFLGGPSLSPSGGVNLFAYDASDGSYLGTRTIPYNNIRKWLVVDDILYTAVGGGDTEGEEAAVLKWVGTPEAPFSGGTNGFEVVGTLESDGAELAFHEGRIFISTWPGGGGSQAAIFMSPVVPEGGLPASTASWQKVWQAGDYEPDPVTAATYGGGAIASFGGYLYWGTMHVPLLALAAHSGVYGSPATQEAYLQAYFGTNRPISIFRGQNFGTGSQTVQLLYGLDEMPVYTPLGPGAGSWDLSPNNMGGVSPLYGQAGFNNYYNNYTWTMSVFRDQLFVGTMDHSYLLGSDIDLPLIGSDPGADLMRFPSVDGAAIAESIDGMGNDSTYGIRTMVKDDCLYLGMANPMNLHVAGGWELLKLDPCFPFTDFDVDGLCSDVDTCPDDAANDADGDTICAGEGFMAPMTGDSDNCPGISNSDQADGDGDDLGDVCDTCPNDPDNDADSDGVCGDVDNCPADANGNQSDGDSDGIGDVCDVCPGDADNDSDGDGICNGSSFQSPKTGANDNCPSVSNSNQQDDDSDDLGNACDACPNDPDNNVDGDSFCGDIDPCPSDANNDADGDTICTGDGFMTPMTGDNDNCPALSNSNQDDSDGDNIGDACDACPNDPNNDADGDSICGDVDACPRDANNDADNDGVCGDVDNCPGDANTDQQNSDGDSMGDVCDSCPNDPDNDADGDSICGDVDACPGDASNDTDGDGICGDVDNCPENANADQQNSDGDSKGDACDLCPNDPEKTEAGICGCGTSDVDSDHDGIPDCNDGCPDDPNKTEPGVNGCGQPEPTDDKNNDGIPDAEQANVTSIQLNNDQGEVVVESSPGTTLSNCQSIENPSPENAPSAVSFPYGLFAFTIENVVAGGSATLIITLPDGANPDKYYKYGPTPSDPTNHWYEFMYDGETGAVINGKTITLHFVDGKRGDSDLDGTNGVIVDPSGPGISTPVASGGDGGDDSGCFIGSLAE